MKIWPGKGRKLVRRDGKVSLDTSIRAHYNDYTTCVFVIAYSLITYYNRQLQLILRHQQYTIHS